MNKLFPKIIFCSVLCLLLGTMSGFSTMEEVNNWFLNLEKPPFTPPGWIFGPVWTLLYILMGVSAAIIWHSDHPLKKRALSLFAVQFALNLAWSFIFFSMNSIGWAFIEIIVMLLFIILTTSVFFRIKRLAGWLMMPYVFWVSFASVLNGAIWYLNR